MNVLSVSLDADIATGAGDARRRQAAYAEAFDSYTVVVKTDATTGESTVDGSLRVIPTCSRSRYLFPVDAYRLAARHCRSHPVDVVTTQDPFSTGVVGWLLSRRFGCRLHTQVHTDFLDNPDWRRGGYGRHLAERIGRFVLARSDAVRVGTNVGRSQVERVVSADVPVVVAPVAMALDDVGRDTTLAERQQLLERLGVDDAPVVLFAGRFVPAKNLEQWVDVAEGVAGRATSSPRFVLVGDGPERDTLERRLEAAGIRDVSVLPGWVDRETLAAYYDIADVFLITSDYEGTSRVVVEAGMNELSVVATPFAGASDNIVHGETGYVAPDTETLADYVLDLLGTPEQRDAFGNAARAHLEERYDTDRLVDAYVQFLRDPRSLTD